MSSILLTGPALEPSSLEETKTFLRVENNDDDPLIAALITAARMHIETQAQAALITQRWRMVFACWPRHGRIAVRPGPLKALTAVRVLDFHGNAQTLDTQAFVPDPGASALAFIPWAVPVPGRIAAGIELDVTVGFGDAATDVPEPLRQAMLRSEFRYRAQRQSAPARTQAARQFECRYRCGYCSRARDRPHDPDYGHLR